MTKTYLQNNRKKPISIFLIVPFIIFFSLVNAQDNSCKKIKNKEAVRSYEKALELLKSNTKIKKEEAYELLMKAVTIEPEYYAAFFTLGTLQYDNAIDALNNPKKHRLLETFFLQSKNYFEKVIEICPSYNDFMANYLVGDICYYLKDYVNARKYLDIFEANAKVNTLHKKEASGMIKGIDSYLNLINNPVPFNPSYVPGICTKEDEYLPLISPDGELAFYTRRYYKTSKDDLHENYVEEFTVSQKAEMNGSKLEKYEKGELMPAPFNDGRNQGGISVTIDNRELFITICAFDGKYEQGIPYINCDIYRSEYIDGAWLPLKKLGPEINNDTTWESQPSITADGKTLFFSSSRKKNSYGGTDIFYSVRDETGRWGNAINLGSAINKAGDEKSPFMHTDSQTLYFSSDDKGRYGMGGFDIFFSKWKEDGTWTEPKNIGYPINTQDDDLGFIVSTNGKKAYFASNKLNGLGGYDVYSFELYKEARPEKVILMKGELKDDRGIALENAKVEIKNTQTSKVIQGLVDKVTGKYAVAIPVKDNDEFIMVVKKPNYAFTSKYIFPDEKNDEEPVKKIDFEVKPITVGKTVKINDIYFPTNSAEFDKASRIVLDNFLSFLEENPSVKIEIQGHTDNVGDDQSNLNLSLRRAQAVFNYLLIMGIDETRMTFKGFGKTKPVASNNTEAGRALNRRTVFVITGK